MQLTVVAAITTFEAIEDVADVRLFSALDRDGINQSIAGAGWTMAAGNNLEGTCN